MATIFSESRIVVIIDYSGYFLIFHSFSQYTLFEGQQSLSSNDYVYNQLHNIISSQIYSPTFMDLEIRISGTGYSSSGL